MSPRIKEDMTSISGAVSTPARPRRIAVPCTSSELAASGSLADSGRELSRFLQGYRKAISRLAAVAPPQGVRSQVPFAPVSHVAPRGRPSGERLDGTRDHPRCARAPLPSRDFLRASLGNVCWRLREVPPRDRPSERPNQTDFPERSPRRPSGKFAQQEVPVSPGESDTSPVPAARLDVVGAGCTPNPAENCSPPISWGRAGDFICRKHIEMDQHYGSRCPD